MEDINVHNYEAFLLDYSEGTLSPVANAALQAFLLLHPELEINLDELALPELFEEAVVIDFKSALKKNESDLPDELLLNYLEDLLTPEQQTAFEHKLQNDAELAGDLALYRKTILHPEAITFEKTDLLKTEDDLVLNNSVIAYAEGQLPASEKAGFEKELKTNGLLQKELALVLKTKAIADLSVIYPGKDALKKENKVIALFSVRTVAALAAAILLLVGLVVVFNHAGKSPAVPKQMADAKGVKDGTLVAPVETTKQQKETEAEILRKAESQPLNNAVKEASKNTAHKSGTKKDTTLFIQQPVEPVNMAQNDKKENLPLAGEKQEAAKNDVVSSEKNNSLPDSSAFTDDGTITHQLVLTAMDDTDDYENGVSKGAKKGFWDRAVQMAKRANKLGVKSIDGVEKPNKAYALSFNSFSVEKK